MDRHLSLQSDHLKSFEWEYFSVLDRWLLTKGFAHGG